MRSVTIGGKTNRVAAPRMSLKFDRLPPSKITLAMQVHEVELDYGRPLTCYKCRRLGHKALECNGKRVCLKCGRDDHLANACKNQSRCVNCHMVHPSNSPDCPRLAMIMERRRLILEAQLTQQIKQTHPTARIEDVEQKRPSAETQSAGRPSYASVLRKVVVDGQNVSETYPSIRGRKPPVAVHGGAGSNPHASKGVCRGRTLKSKGKKEADSSRASSSSVAALNSFIRVISRMTPATLNSVVQIFTQVAKSFTVRK